MEGVREVHDVHAWTITSGFDAVSVHVIAAPGIDQHALLHRLEEVLQAQFGVTPHDDPGRSRPHSPAEHPPQGVPGGSEATDQRT